MENDELKKLQKIQTKNVQHLKKVQKNLAMDINSSLLKGDAFKVSMKTKLFGLLYSALSEAQFVQILYTPYGFRGREICKIRDERSIFKQWELMIDIAIRKAGTIETNEDLRNRRNFLHGVIKEYIEKPQLIRNKIAHGQWIHALNGNMTDENSETSNAIENINVVEISKWFEVHQFLCFIVRDLIQSPETAFHNNYWEHYAGLQTFLEVSKDWTLDKRVEDIKRKFNNR